MKEEERKNVAQLLPKMEELNRPFWEGLAEKKLMIQHCKDCGSYQIPANVFCENCLSDNVEWVEASGKAKLWSTVVFRKSYLKTQYPDAFRVVCAKLEEGPSLYARMALDAEIEFDGALRAVYHKTEDGTYLLGFEPEK
jgi:uncharacterized OB-fold protein